MARKVDRRTIEAALRRKGKLLKNLSSYFYEGILAFSLEDEDIQRMTWDTQEEFLNMTVNTSRVQKYPVNKNFSRLYFKKLIDILQPTQEIHDGLFSSLCSAMSNEAADDFCYRHYLIQSNLNNVITLKETNNMVVNGTTGLKTWEAAVVLADWAIINTEVFIDKIVLELGSGLGLPSFVISKMCFPEHTLLTDCHEDVLRTLCENVVINFPNSTKEEKNEEVIYRGPETSIGVMPLDWNLIEQLSPEIVPDVVIGADIVYDPSILQPLCNVFEEFFKRNKHVSIYIQSVIRNEETFKIFTDLLDEIGFDWEDVGQERWVHFHWSWKINRKLLKITKF